MDSRVEITTSLLQELKLQNAFDSDHGYHTRQVPENISHLYSLLICCRNIVHGSISGLVKLFVRHVCARRGLSEAVATYAGGNIYEFGSCRLDVHGPDSDLDILCVFSKSYVSRDDFFKYFAFMLRELDGVTEVLVSLSECRF